jgi:hypothetical protein
MEENKRDMSNYDPEKELDDLHRALEESKKSESKPAYMQVEDLSSIANQYLSASARHDLSQKATQLTVKYDDGRFYSAIYLATRVIKGDEERAVEYLARVINDLSQRGLIHSTLAPISSMQLALSTSVLQSVVFTFILIPQESHKEVQNLYPEFVMQEGDVGRELYDLSPILSPGEFLAKIRISHCIAVLQPCEAKDSRAYFHAQLEEYLAVLPKGTRVRKVTQLAITGLSLDFEVKFYNELLQDVKEVELEHRRACAMVDNEFKQFNVLVGVKYIDKDGNFLYK